MKANKVKWVIAGGVLCVLLLLLSVWYAATFNGGRLVEPMDFSTYTFQIRDLPMLCSTALFTLYVLGLAVWLVRWVLKSRRVVREANTTRSISPKLGFLGFLGFPGFLGFWSYGMFRDVSPFIFFTFFGFFGFFYEGKLSNTFMDERFRENAVRAQLTAMRVSFAIIFLTLIVLGRGTLLGSLEYTLIAVLILLSLSVALALFLSEYLLYRYDHDDQIEEGDE